MTDYTKDQEREALTGKYIDPTVRDLRDALADRFNTIMKVTAERDALKEKLEASRVGSERWHSVALESQRERDALKARVAELEAKTAPPTVAPTREVWEALSEFVQPWGVWNGQEPMGAAARLVVAIRKMLEVKP